MQKYQGLYLSVLIILNGEKYKIDKNRIGIKSNHLLQSDSTGYYSIEVLIHFAIQKRHLVRVK